MRKVYIANTSDGKIEYRLIVNVNDYYSVGVKMNFNELQQVYYEIKNLLDAEIKKQYTNIEEN